MSMGVRHFWHASPCGFLSFAIMLSLLFLHASEVIELSLVVSGDK
jgi:hypothetical protein